jgi:hypothetical protein
MLRKLPLIALLSMVLVPLSSEARRPKLEEIKNPSITLETKATAAQIKKGVKMAVLNRKWNIQNEKAAKDGTEFDAEYEHHFGRSNTSAKIHVVVKGKTVNIKYVSSDGLSAEGDQIARDYNAWVTNLEKDIPIYVEREVTASQ